MEKRNPRGLGEIILEAQIQDGIRRIESANPLICAVCFDIEDRVQRLISEKDNVDLSHAVHLVFDVTKISPPGKYQSERSYRKTDKAFETRIAYAYDELYEYGMDDFSTEARNILLSTRKRAVMAVDKINELMQRGEFNQKFETIPYRAVVADEKGYLTGRRKVRVLRTGGKVFEMNKYRPENK